ncbi:hypothetical protein [Nocardia sp. NPDC056000]|uniref:hypothetical protein n=1 Tax=Nocardia sp. NPDC056000 TaxID=3345674 RepID=UPI0035E2A5D7
MSIYTGEPEKLHQVGVSTEGCHLELEGYLSALTNVQDELHAAVVSKGAGSAIYVALGDAHQKGKSLSSTLNEIVTELRSTGVKIESSDLDGASMMNSAAVAHDGGGGWSGSSAASLPPKISAF